MLKTRIPTATCLTLSFLISGCTNSFDKNISRLLSGTSSTNSTNTTGGGTTLPTFVISNVSIATSSSSSSSSSTYVTNVFFDTVKSPEPILNHCNVASGSSVQSTKPCLCQFTWNEINPNTGTSSPILRTVQTAATNVQPSLVSCNAPDVYGTEIPDGTQIKITVLGAPGNGDASAFAVGNFNYTKNNGAVSGSFQDSQGHIFDNVLHYSCYQKFMRGMSIQSKISPTTNPQTGEARSVVLASQFCVSTASGSGSSTSGCSTPPADYSAQAYFFNLYIRNSERGDINQFNDGFVCPLVYEALDAGSSAGTHNQAWPLDTAFALSLGPTTDFSVGVQANTKLSGGQDPTAASNTCFASGSSSSSGSSSAGTNTIINSCLGFAAKVNNDGTCPNIKDASGLIRNTFRLRRYIALYPRVFDTDGKPISGQSQAVDTIYVLDRPVKGPVNADPLRPYTMLGPKPCPQAFFDRKGVTGNVSYMGTSSVFWKDKNVDGIELPNIDGTAADGSPSCSAALPILSDDRSRWSITTVNLYNSTVVAPYSRKHVYVRPSQPFSPHYEEDTSFLACAPQASPVKDPPLHFARDINTGNVAWCAESYPTQNTNITSLDPAVTPTPGPTIPTGAVSPFTSHTVNNTASNVCVGTTFTIPSSNYDYNSATGAKYARHLAATSWDTADAAKTCDRSVSSTGLTWTRFPLLSPSTDTELAIAADSSYFCTMTYDNGGGKVNKTTPADGCCDKNAVFVQTGNAGQSIAHLEPDVSCKTPKY